MMSGLLLKTAYNLLPSDLSIKRTQMQLYMQKDKEKQDAAAERLIHSVNAVTELLKANTELKGHY